jgi:hypothetical protein
MRSGSVNGHASAIARARHVLGRVERDIAKNWAKPSILCTLAT